MYIYICTYIYIYIYIYIGVYIIYVCIDELLGGPDLGIAEEALPGGGRRLVILLYTIISIIFSLLYVLIIHTSIYLFTIIVLVNEYNNNKYFIYTSIYLIPIKLNYNKMNIITLSLAV